MLQLTYTYQTLKNGGLQAYNKNTNRNKNKKNKMNKKEQEREE